MKLTTRKDKAFLKLEGDLTVAQAAEFKNALATSLTKADTIEIDLKDVTRIDLACLQLMCSAHLSAANSSKSLTIKDPSLPVFQEARENSGFIYSKPCRRVSVEDCLWTSGGME